MVRSRELLLEMQLKNAPGVYFMTASALSLLRKGDNPNVIVISSLAGLAYQRATGNTVYGASKVGHSFCNPTAGIVKILMLSRQLVCTPRHYVL
jgi:NADP-dependent 3-hydroxy acid dehydrogenase YdfG